MAYKDIDTVMAAQASLVDASPASIRGWSRWRRPERRPRTEAPQNPTPKPICPAVFDWTAHLPLGFRYTDWRIALVASSWTNATTTNPPVISCFFWRNVYSPFRVFVS